MGGWTDGQMDGQMDRQTDGWMDKPAYRDMSANLNTLDKAIVGYLAYAFQEIRLQLQIRSNM